MDYEILSETRDVKGFNRVVMREYGILNLNQGDEEKLVIKGASNVLRMVRSSVSDGQLILDIEGGWWDRTWSAFTSTVERKPLKYELTVRNLSGLYVSGAGRVKSKGLRLEDFQLILKGAGEVILSDINAKHLDVELPGAGIISLSGKVNRQEVYLRGAGSYDAPRLESEIAHVKLHGVGKATVWATRSLDARVDGVGTIEYYGSPDVRRSVSGLGKVHQRGI